MFNPKMMNGQIVKLAFTLSKRFILCLRATEELELRV